MQFHPTLQHHSTDLSRFKFEKSFHPSESSVKAFCIVRWVCRMHVLEGSIWCLLLKMLPLWGSYDRKYSILCVLLLNVWKYGEQAVSSFIRWPWTLVLLANIYICINLLVGRNKIIFCFGYCEIPMKMLQHIRKCWISGT